MEKSHSSCMNLKMAESSATGLGTREYAFSISAASLGSKV